MSDLRVSWAEYHTLMTLAEIRIVLCELGAAVGILAAAIVFADVWPILPKAAAVGLVIGMIAAAFRARKGQKWLFEKLNPSDSK